MLCNNKQVITLTYHVAGWLTEAGLAIQNYGRAEERRIVEQIVASWRKVPTRAGHLVALTTPRQKCRVTWQMARWQAARRGSQTHAADYPCVRGDGSDGGDGACGAGGDVRASGVQAQELTSGTRSLMNTKISQQKMTRK